MIQEKLCLTQFSAKFYWNTSLVAHDLFPLFTQSVNFYILYCHIIKGYWCLKNVNHQLEKNEWLLLSTFQQGLQQKLFFVLKEENTFLQRFHFKANRKSIGSFKIAIFKIALHLRDWYAFMWESLEILNYFNTLTLK